MSGKKNDDEDKSDKSETTGTPGETFTPLGGGAYMSNDSGDVVESKDIVAEDRGNQSNGSRSK